jgi:hypothetical protein
MDDRTVAGITESSTVIISRRRSSRAFLRAVTISFLSRHGAAERDSAEAPESAPQLAITSMRTLSDMAGMQVPPPAIHHRTGRALNDEGRLTESITLRDDRARRTSTSASNSLD